MLAHASRILSLLCLLTAAVLLPRAVLAGPAAQPAAPEELAARLAAVEKAIDTRRQALHVPGAALAIVKDDRVIYLNGLGLKDVDQNLRVTPDTLFAIGSSTKAFTAMTVMMSVDEGKLSLADSPKKYLPYFKLRDPEADSKITLMDLLSHRSGLERTDLAWYTGKLNAREIIQVAGNAKPSAKLGEKFQYQNVMYLAAGEVVAKVQKRPWEEMIARRILQPLGMRSSSTSVRELEKAPDFALGYAWDAQKKEYLRLPIRDIQAIAPAGAINSNARDMARWVRLMLGGGEFEGKRLVSRKSFDELTVPRITIAGTVSYGLGWFLRQWNGHKVVEHGGNIDGFNAQVALMPDQKLGFVLLTNVSASPLGTYAMNTIWEKLVGAPQPAPAPPAASTAEAAPPAEPAAEAGNYRLAAANLTITIAQKEGKLTLQVAGQPAVPLENMGGRRYRAVPPAQDGVFVTFRAVKEKPQQSEMLLEQPGGQIVLDRETPQPAPEAFTPPLTSEELMRKVIEAAGGEANLRKHRTMLTEFTMAMESQGITARGVQYQRAPNALTQSLTLLGGEKKIATIRDYFDGARGGSESSFSQPDTKTGTELDNAALQDQFYGDLNWKTLYKSVAIRKLAKVGDEEVYVVEKTPQKGSPVTDYISTRSFLVLKRESLVALPGNDSALPTTETLSDYRSVDGVMIPFRREQSAAQMGGVLLTVKKVRFDARIPDAVFQPSGKH